MKLLIRHTGTSQEGIPSFVVVSDEKQEKRIVPLTPPGMIKVGTHSKNLLQDLRWYFENYLELAVGDYRIRAEDIQAALRQWGKDCFDALFGEGRAYGWYRDARQTQLSDLRIKIASDDPAVLSWPWEALESPDDGYLAQQCRIERQLDDIGDAFPLSRDLPADQLNILYIIARPYGEGDEGFGALARPLVDFVEEGGWPVHIDMLRPPTFSRLRDVLDDRPGFYHIVHFDGHGMFNRSAATTGSAAPAGVLAFETDDQKEDLIPAAKLCELLRPHNIPVMILTACQSAMIDASAADPFASVAMSLMKAGIRSVVAMSYSLWVCGAQIFVPEFYRQLFSDGSVAAAMQAARRRMLEKNIRERFGVQTEFNDWVVPVLYQQSAEGILPKLKPGGGRIKELPPEVIEPDDYGFIGRDKTIRRLETAIRRSTAGILIHGMAGEGKTTVAKGFLQWLEATNGLGAGAFWFNFENIHSAGYIVDGLTDALFGTNEMALPLDRKLALITKAMRDEQYFIVWDNFESASGIAGSEVSALLPEDDRKLLKQLLRSLRNGKTKIIITSRSPENWLNIQDCYRLALGGMDKDEFWQYCSAVVADLGLSLDRKDATYKELMDKLDGNPLAARAILFRLAECTAKTLLAELEDDFKGYKGDDATYRTQAALSVFERGLDRDFAPALRFLGIHEQYAHAGKIEAMLEKTGETAPLEDCFTALESAGLCRFAEDGIYRIHPALRGCLVRRHPATEEEKQAFVKVMAVLADEYAPKPLHEQRSAVKYYSANFHRALKLARELDMRNHTLALLQVLAAFAQNNRSFSEAEDLIEQLSEASKEYGNATTEAVAYHQLGLISNERQDFQRASGLFELSMGAEADPGNLRNTAITYHQLGVAAQGRRDFDAAGDLYRRSLEIWLKLGDESSAASTYHQFGTLAHDLHDFDAAGDWYNKSLAIALKQNDKPGIAQTRHQMGIIAMLRKDFNAAQDLCRQSMDIYHELKDETGAAGSYHQLGIIAQERGALNEAESWYKKALEINLRQGDKYGEGLSCNQLGLLAYKQNDYKSAYNWYMQSLGISVELGDVYSSALTFHQMSMISLACGDLDNTVSLLQEALAVFEKYNDPESKTNTESILSTLAIIKKFRNGDDTQ